MPAWRREALAAFPELHTELNDVHDMFSVSQLWFALLPFTWRAHQAEDEDFLRRVYAYEHLVDSRQDHWWARVIPRLSDTVIADVRPEWTERLTPTELDRVRKVMRDQGRRIPADTD